MEPVSKLLRIYLHDHLAGATAGVARARRLAEAEASAADGAVLGELAASIEEDRRTLVATMGSMGVAPSRVKNAAAAGVERLGRLKLNGFVLRRSPSTPLVEIEALRMAVEGKRSLWEALASGAVPTPPATDAVLDALIRRADEQLAQLRALHADRLGGSFVAAP